MAVILGITTSTARGGASIWSDGRCLGARTYDDPRGHAEKIFATIDGALADAKLDRHAIEAIACDVGPGSFTGVRVAVASAKGVAIGLRIEAIAVGSLEAIAHAAYASGVEKDDLVLASLSVRGGDASEGDELIVALLDAAGATLIAPRIVVATAAAIDAFVAEAAPSRGPKLFGAWPAGVSQFAGAVPALPSAEAVAEIGAARLADASRVDRELDALYVRAAVSPPTPRAAPSPLSPNGRAD